MAKRKTRKAANPLQAALDAAGHTATVDAYEMGEDGLSCAITVAGVAYYDRIQRQDRTDDELLAAAVSAFPRHAQVKDGRA